MKSPFANVFSDSPLPPVFAAQFLFSADQLQPVILEGEMTRIWLKHGWLRPMGWLMSRFGLLISGTGEHIPTRVEITTHEDTNGVHHHYRRIFQFTRPEIFKTVTSYLTKLDRTVEFMGLGRALMMVWQSDYQPPNRLLLSSERFGLHLFGLVIPFPAWLSRWLFGHADFVQTALTEDTTSIELVISHPLIGDIFGYEGIFKVHTEL